MSSEDLKKYRKIVEGKQQRLQLNESNREVMLVDAIMTDLQDVSGMLKHMHEVGSNPESVSEVESHISAAIEVINRAFGRGSKGSVHENEEEDRYLTPDEVDQFRADKDSSDKEEIRRIAQMFVDAVDSSADVWVEEKATRPGGPMAKVIKWNNPETGKESNAVIFAAASSKQTPPDNLFDGIVQRLEAKLTFGDPSGPYGAVTMPQELAVARAAAQKFLHPYHY